MELTPKVKVVCVAVLISAMVITSLDYMGVFSVSSVMFGIHITPIWSNSHFELYADDVCPETHCDPTYITAST